MRWGVLFQEGALFSSQTVAENIQVPLREYTTMSQDLMDQIAAMKLAMVGLPPDTADKYPSELSGGMKQRVGIARALALTPDLLVADEPTSALDVSVQARFLTLLSGLQERFGFACLFISHDLAVVDELADRIVVMHRGKIVEQGAKDAILRNPQDPYTQQLIAAVPVPDPVAQRKRREGRTAK
jgi:peptide/nickel transport system ATP-binding protein